ncbi:MAG: diguanylate cyclase [Deltaproteobacteria bacterium]|nr:diguanylate cyclase [Deltaproteobacteria bacterium]
MCEQTVGAGTFLLAERIGEELQRQVFQSEHGPVRVTCSLGVSAFPGDGDSRAVLFERADQALYAAKHNGRNQTRSASPTEAPSDVRRRSPVSARRAPRPRRPQDRQERLNLGLGRLMHTPHYTDRSLPQPSRLT